MDITGKLIRVLESQSGKSSKGAWKKQEFIIETLDVYPKRICISNWNDKSNLNKLEIGDIIKVYVQIESSEYNNKWYTDIKVWKLDVMENSKEQNNIEDVRVSEKEQSQCEFENFNEQEDEFPF